MINNVLIVCTSNKDRSPALQEYLGMVFPDHEYRSAGINEYFCQKKGTHLITVDDVFWADLIVFAEDVHLKVTCDRFGGHTPIPNGNPRHKGSIVFGQSPSDKGLIKLEKHAKFIVLNCGEYKQGCIGEDYLTKAEMLLKELLNNQKN